METPAENFRRTKAGQRQALKMLGHPFPDIEELNREIHEDAGLPEHFRLDRRPPQDGCLAVGGAADVTRRLTA